MILSQENAASRLVSMGYFALIAVTWPLWIGRTAFPQVPLIGVAIAAPQFIEWALLVGLLVTLGCLLFLTKQTFRRAACLMMGLCTLGLVLIDQHRLQPWVWQFLILSLVLASADFSVARACWRWLVIGIYAWSAWSKMDYGFCLEHGPFLLDGICRAVGLAKGTGAWPDAVRWGMSAMIPLFELSIAFGLCWKRTRRFAVLGAACMHVGLLLALGPRGHGHQPGVLVWNVFFLIQNFLIFRDPPLVAGRVESETIPRAPRIVSPRISPLVPSQLESIEPKSKNPGAYAFRLAWFLRFRDRFAKIVVYAALAWPLLEPFGLCDHWPAWAVYAAKPERVSVFIAEEELEKVPASMQDYLGPPPLFDQWYLIRIDRWSLDAVDAPIYPQDRFQVGVALALVRDWKLNQIRVVIEGPANRWTGKRIVREFVGIDSVEQLADSYRLNARPR